jgi:uncharacterized protein
MNNKYNEIIKELTDKELLFHLYATQIVLLLITFVLGILLYDHFSFLNQLKWNDIRILTIGAMAGLLVVIIDIVLMKWLPSSYYHDGGLNEKIFQNRNIFHIAWITVTVAFSEEMLFRGIIQTRFGLIVASLVFAVIHYRYLFNWFLFINIVLLSFLIGFIYEWTNNLAVTIVMHFVIDFLLGIHIKYKNFKDNEQEGLFNE